MPLREDDAIGKENTRRGNKAEKRKKQQQQQHENPRMLVGCNSCAAHNNVSSPQHQTRFSYSLRTLQPIASPSRSLSLSLSTPKKQEEDEEEADSGGTEPCVQQRSDQLHNNPAPCVARLLFFSFGFNSTVFFLVGYTAASSRTRQQHFPTVEMIRINWRERERDTKHRDRERENDRRQQRVI